MNEQREGQKWDDNAIIAAYQRAFDTNPDVHHMALMTWIRDEYEARIDQLESQLATVQEWQPVEYDDIFTREGEPTRPDYKRICEKWEDFNARPSNTEDGYEYAICRTPAQGGDDA